MHILDRVPLLVVDFVQWPVPDVTGIVDEDVDVAELLQRGGNEAARKLRISDIAWIGDRCPAGVP